MPATLTAAGLQIQTFEEALAEYVATIKARFGDDADTAAQSFLGTFARVCAEFDVSNQELLVAIVAACDPEAANGINLDRVVRVNGVRRRPQTRSRVEAGLFTGTPGTVITDGRRVRLQSTSSQWRVIDGPYVIGGGGTVVGTVEAVEAGPIVAATTSTGWVILDSIVGWSAFGSTADAIVGTNIEDDKSLRQRFDASPQAGARGPLGAISAAVANVAGILSVVVYQNLGLAVDVNGLPGKSVNVVLDGVGHDPDEVRAAIFGALPCGCEAYGTDVVGSVVDDEGATWPVNYDEVDAIPIWVRATLTTSTAEEIYPENGDTAVADALLELGNAAHPVGRDVKPYRFAGAIDALALDGIDAVLVEVSDDGATWTSSKFGIGIRERATFDSAHITVVHA